MTKAFLYGRLPFPIDAIRRRLAWLWWEPAVLLLPWRIRVAFWNLLFGSNVDARKTSDPFMLQWLQKYWPFEWRWIPVRLHDLIWAYCFPKAS